MRRGPVTWCSYLLLGFFTYLLNMQGNIVPFLQDELSLSYRVVSLHSSAVAAGMIAVGLLGDRVIRRIGRRRALWLAAAGAGTGAVLLCLAPAAWASIGSCALIGALGGLIPAIVPAVLSEAHGDRRDVAYAEANAMSYAFAITAPLAMSLCIAAGAGWRSAVLLGVAAGAVIALRFARVLIPDVSRAGSAASAGGVLPAAFWAYWCLLGLSVAIEFCVLVWAPAFLEHVVGLAQSTAAASAAAFSAGMLAGRLCGGVLVRRVAASRLFPACLLLALAGFGLYWGIGGPAAAIAGLVVLGLGIGPLYPLSLGLAIGAAGAQGDKASARFMLSTGLAILATPALLGALADEVGLRQAHLVLPALVGAALLCLGFAQRLARPPGDAVPAPS